ncbi:MAG: Gfo/Idh/MocA family oxidoreductase [Candidatus Woesearchaeota archaeon]
MQKYKIGIVGCGYWGPNLVRNFSQNIEVEEVVCCDLNEERLKQMKLIFHNVKTTTDYEALLKTDIDGVVIATPVATHYGLAKQALEHGKHTLVEKPITKTSSEALELTRIAKKAGKTLMVDHTFEYSTSVRKIKEIIDKKELGEIFNIHITRINLGLFQKDVNVLWDLTPHDISMLRFLLGSEPISARTFAESHVMPNNQDTAHVILKFPNNVAAHLHVSWLSPRKIREMTIIGSKKMLVYDDVSQSEKIKIFDKGVSIENHGLPPQQYYGSFGDFQLLYRSGDIYIPKIDDREPLKEVSSHFIECIKTGRNPLSDGYSGYKVMLALEAAQKSLESNGDEVFLDSKE